MRPVLIALVGFLAALLIVTVWEAAAHPYADFPVVSQWVCALKGGAWYGGGWLGPAGCYTAGG